MDSAQAFRVSVCAIVALLSGAQAESAGNYPLEVTNLRSAGAGYSPNHRIYRAYPGLEYNIRAAVIGGDYPYTFSLENAPAGMAVDRGTGEISWTNPQSDASPTLTVRDSLGAQVSVTWRISVTTKGFQFIDAMNGTPASGGGTGTSARPWRTLGDMRAHGAAAAITYFRAGVYTPAGMPTEGAPGPNTPETRVVFNETTHSVVWLGYPGDAKPVIDFAHDGGNTTPRFRMRGPNVYIDGFETRRSHIMAFQVFNEGRGQTAPTFRRMRMHTHGPGMRGANAALIMTTFGEAPADYLVVQDSAFFGVTDGTGNCALKLYSQNKPLIEDNLFYDTDTGSEAILAIKQDLRQFTVRGNRFDVPGKAIGGNMSSGGRRVAGSTYGEILFNYVRGQRYALDLNQDSAAGVVDIYRNTFIGRVQVRNTDAVDGPFRFSRNVLVNSDSGSRIYQDNVSAPDRIVLSENVTSTPRDNPLDATGQLTGKYAKFGETHGVPGGRGELPGEVRRRP